METPALGGEIYAGIFSRFNKIRRALEEDGILTLPLSMHYYEMGMRDHAPDESDVPACIPGPGRRSVGLRVVNPNEEDPFYPFYLESKGLRAASTLRNAALQAARAVEIGAMPLAKGRSLMRGIDKRVGKRPAILANGGSTAQIAHTSDEPV